MMKEDFTEAEIQEFRDLMEEYRDWMKLYGNCTPEKALAYYFRHAGVPMPDGARQYFKTCTGDIVD